MDAHGPLARYLVLQGLPAFLAEYPDLQLHIGEGDRLVDLVHEGVDCVLRVGDLKDSAMVGRHVAVLEEVTCASQDYLARHSVPVSNYPGQSHLLAWHPSSGPTFHLQLLSRSIH